jgi:hypothetical protein
MTTLAWKPTSSLRWLLLAVMAGLMAGCATAGAELERQYYALAQEEFFVKQKSTVWSRPDRTSDERGYALVGYKVTELDRDRRGWSKVRVHDPNLTGWLPTAVLTKKPVQPAAAAKVAQPKSAPAQSKAVSEPAAPPKGDSVLSPPAAHAAPPPAKKESTPAKERKADPKKFEPL